MPTTDDPFAFTSGTLRLGSGPIVPVENFEITYVRGTQPWPGPIHAGQITVSGTIHSDLDQWAGIRDMRCPGCGTAFGELEPGHSWSSARGGCWVETGPIDEYGRPIKEGKDD